MGLNVVVGILAGAGDDDDGHVRAAFAVIGGVAGSGWCRAVGRA
jgi:hypothetical protein